MKYKEGDLKEMFYTSQNKFENNISIKSKENYFFSLMILLIIDLLIIGITFLGFNQNFDFRMIILNIIVFFIILLLTKNDILLRKISIKALVIFHIILLLIISLNGLSAGKLTLFQDDFSYNKWAENSAKTLPFFRQIKLHYFFKGAYYFRFLEIAYRIFGINTLVGRFLNIFFLLLIGILIKKAFLNTPTSNKRALLFILFFPDLIVFSMFEFKDILFSFLCVLIVFLFKKALSSNGIIKKFILIFLALIVAYYSSWYRVGVGYVYFGTSILYLLLPKKFKKRTLIISPLFLLFLITAIYLTLIYLKNIYINSFIFEKKFLAYFELSNETILQSGFLKLFYIRNISDIYKVPLGMLFVAYSPINWFSSKTLNFFLFSISRFFSFSLLAPIFFSLLTKKCKIKADELFLIFFPTLFVLNILIVTNIGVLRHFIFLLPFIILIGNKYNSLKIKDSILFGSTIYFLYFLFLLFRN
ncbi:hypothetical protein XO09_04270 [Thermosipho sp. 1223]|nr:hypothetical protein [Thermosipho sp. 1244]OOC46903.1 hypothetical protein XO09_04270 [Thermosipho sp. 1223]